MAPRRTWTFPMLKSAKARVEAGETWDEVSQDMGVNVSTLRKQIFKQLGPLDHSNRPRRFSNEALLIKAISLRNRKGLSYGMIKDEIGWPKKVISLRQAVKRYAAYHNIKLKSGWPTHRKCRWDNHDD